MALIACPKCATTLRVSDGSAAAVRCPKCKTVFTPPPPQPAFEVVDESPPPPPRPAPKPVPKPAPKSAPKPAEPEPDFEVIDEESAPRKRSRRDDDDDDDNDRPRGRRRGRDDDYDDEDDRPRRRGRRSKRRVWDDYDAIERAGAFRRGRLACLLLSISIWLYMGALGVLTLFALLIWSGANITPNLFIIPGLAGMGNWVVALVGLGFAVSGPRQGKGLAIGAVSVAGVHFVLLVVCFTQLQGAGGGLGGARMFGLGGFEWIAMITMIPMVDALLPALIYGSGMIGSEFVFAVLAGGCEIARLIVMLLMIQAFARAARDGGAEDKAGGGVMVVSVVCGAVALLVTLMVVIVYEGKLVSSAGTLAGLTAVGSLTAYTLMLILPGMAAVDTKDALDRRI